MLLSLVVVQVQQLVIVLDSPRLTTVLRHQPCIYEEASLARLLGSGW